MFPARRAVLGAALAAFTTLPMLGIAAQAVGAPLGGNPVVVDLPARDRATPRAATPVGLTDDYGVLTWREPDPRSDQRYRPSMVQVLADGNTIAPVDRQVGAVFGNRLVAAPGDTATTVESRMLPDGEWAALSVPDGWRLWDYSADGLLIASNSVTLAVLPWDGGDPRPVAGVPAEVTSTSSRYMREWQSGKAPHGTVLEAADGTGSGWLYVDTAAARAWMLDINGDCAPTGNTPWGLHDGQLAWHTLAGDQQAGHRLCTLGLPTIDTPSPGPAATRPAPLFPNVTSQVYDVAVLPLGDDVLTWRRPAWYSAASDWRAFDRLPVTAVAADGATRSVAGWGHSVTPAGPGQVLVVGGPTWGDAGIRLHTATGDDQTVATLPRLPALYESIAVDDDRVAFVDDSAPRQGLIENTLDQDDTWRHGTGRVVDAEVATALSAGDGALAWSTTLDSTTVGNRWAVRSPDGTIRRGLASSGITVHQIAAVSGPWVLRDYFGTDYLLNTATGTQEATGTSGVDVDLLDGVLYLPNASVPGSPAGTVVARDLATGQAATVATPGCVRSWQVRVAGSWMLVRCTGGDAPYVVIDRSGATAPRLTDELFQIGNGFAVREAGGYLEWADLNVDGPLAWQRLDAMPVEPSDGRQPWSFSRGAVPTLAWFSLRGAKMATLPVATSPLPAKPTGVTAPSAPTIVATEPANRVVTVRWAAPDPQQQVTAFEVRAGSKTQTVEATKTAYTISGLTNGIEYPVTVTAVNIAGRGTSSPVAATPLAPPPAPRNVQVTVDPLTSHTTVTWDWTAATASEQVTGFELGNGDVFARVGPDARSASFVVDPARVGAVTVYALGTQQTNSFSSDEVLWPGADHTAPTVRAEVATAATLESATSVRVSASDDRKLAADAIDVRMRTAQLGARLGPWQFREAWQGRPVETITADGLRPGWTYCFSARARDHVGNVSSWSAPTCTAVAADDRILTASRWRKITGGKFFGGSAHTSSDVRATLLSQRVDADAAWLVATTCPRCGKVRVLVNNITCGSVNLYSSTTRHQQLLRIPWAGRLYGKVVMRPNGKPVTVDGFAVRAR